MVFSIIMVYQHFTQITMGYSKNIEENARLLKNEMEYLGIDDYRIIGITDGTLMNYLDCMIDIPLKKYSKIFPEKWNNLAILCR